MMDGMKLLPPLGSLLERSYSMTLTAIYKDNSLEFTIVPGEIVGNTYRCNGERPKHFVIPKGLSPEEINYLKDYCSAAPRYE